MGAFGEKLRQQREQRGIALDAISSTTKISTRMLRALEDEHFDQLPGGVFNKGFVRAYARQVGLDEEEAVSDYLAALRESQIQQHSILPDFRAPAGKAVSAGAADPRKQDLAGNLRDADFRDDLLPRNDGKDHIHQPKNIPASPDSVPAQRPPLKYPAGIPAQMEPSTHIPWGSLAAALLVVTLLVAFWNFRRRAELKSAPPTVASAQQASAQPAVPASVPRQAPPSTSTNSLRVGKSSSPGTLSPGTNAAETPSLKPVPAAGGGSAPTLAGASTSPKAAASNPSTTTSTAGNPPAATTSSPAKAATRAAASKPPSTFTLLIRAEKTSWISIIADGKLVAEENLIAPAHTSVRAAHEIVVRAGNAAGVSFLLNGKEYPAQGNDGEVKTYVFDASGPQ